MQNFFPDEGQGKKDGPKQAGKASSGGKAGRSGFEQSRHWGTKEEALAGVPTEECKEYGTSRDGCWRCGRTRYKTFECYAGTTTGGTTLPAAPWRGASSAKRKRDGEADESTSPTKQDKTVTIKPEDKDMHEAVAAWTTSQQETDVWEQNTDNSDF